MSLAICAYVLLFTALVASAAAAMEWGAQGRISVRHLWSAAICIAFLAPPAVLALHAEHRRAVVEQDRATPNLVTSAAATADRTSMRSSATLTNHVAPSRLLITPGSTWTVLATGAPSKLIPVLVPLWICASAALVAWLLAGALHWRRTRRDWRSTVVDGVQVEISPATGPAVLGVISHRIVMPAWAMSMQPEQRKLMLAHECEHVSAHDPERLAIAVLVLVLMPWNAVLWWCTARLRRAIELDCDARVLRRYPGAKEYGHLLLDVASRGQGFEPIGIPSMALLRMPSELELRLRVMMRPRHAARRAIVAGAGIAIIAVAAAFTTPVPELPLRRANISRPGSATAPQSGVTLHHVTVRVGRSLVTFDSAMYSPTAHTIRAGKSTIASLYLASGDTNTANASRDTIDVLRRKADSLHLVSGQLAIKTHELDAMHERMKATSMQPDSSQWMNFDVSEAEFIKQQAIFKRDQATFMKQQARFKKEEAVESAVRNKALPAATARYYPDLSASANLGTILWFLVDSSGRVMRTARDEGHDPSMPVSNTDVAERFPGTDSHYISFTVGSMMAGNAHITFVWATVTRP